MTTARSQNSEKVPGAKKAPVKKLPAANKAPAHKAVSARRPKKAPAEQASRAASDGSDATGTSGASDPSGRDTSDASDMDEVLAEARELLLAERATYAEQAQLLKAEADLLVQEAEPGDVQFDEESGEGGTMTVDRERDLALAGQARAAVEEIDHALAKVEAGTYGTCERCHERIPRPRLRALPYARLCVACKSGGLSRR